MADRLLVLGLGSNLGDRQSFLEQGQKALETAFGKLVAASRILETEPWGVENHPSYLNQILVFGTQMPVREVLEITQNLEKSFGRNNKGNLMARTLDIDLLYLGLEMYSEPDLIVPHPRIAGRRFVLAPLAEVLPHFCDPVTGKDLAQLLLICPDSCKVGIHRPGPR